MTWRCPHCATPQPEASRCWVCHRSSTSCATCRQFRRSVAARTGYCGLDRKRAPLDGDEVRACWEDGAVPLEPEPPIPGLLDLLSERALPVLPSPATVPAAAASGVAPAARMTARTDEEPDDPFAEERARTGERSVGGALRLRPDGGVVVRREWVELEV
jgi:hypothetical protein